MNQLFRVWARRRWSAAAFAFLALSNAATWIVAQSPYATELIAQNGAYGGASLYNNPNAVLGEPTRIAADTSAGNNPYHISLVQAVQNHDLAGNNVLTTLSRTANGSGGFTYGSITVKFDHPVLDDPANPYGIDLNVFGNAFYVGSGFANDATDMRTYNLTGNSFAEPVSDLVFVDARATPPDIYRRYFGSTEPLLIVTSI